MNGGDGLAPTHGPREEGISTDTVGESKALEEEDHNRPANAKTAGYTLRRVAK